MTSLGKHWKVTGRYSYRPSRTFINSDGKRVCRGCSRAQDSRPLDTCSDIEHHWNNYMKRLYKFSYQEYIALKARQKGLCAICHKKKKLSIDHSHLTQMVRGLLCNECNHLVGWIESRFYSVALRYLRNSQSSETFTPPLTTN